MMFLFENLCFVVLGVTGTEGQETEGFLGARNMARLLVGWEDSIVSLWASERKTNSWKHSPTTRITALQLMSFNKPWKRYFLMVLLF
jgi:hypothetical protein